MTEERDKLIAGLTSKDPAVKGKIAVSGPCRLTKAERRIGESKAFKNRREKNRARNKLAKASRKR